MINYFWEHWIYLGLVWGLIMVGALTVWLRVLGVPSAAFCWMVWAILGQASGAYVGPPAGPCCFSPAQPPYCISAPHIKRTFEEDEALRAASVGGHIQTTRRRLATSYPMTARRKMVSAFKGEAVISLYQLFVLNWTQSRHGESATGCL